MKKNKKVKKLNFATSKGSSSPSALTTPEVAIEIPESVSVPSALAVEEPKKDETQYLNQTKLNLAKQIIHRSTIENGYKGLTDVSIQQQDARVLAKAGGTDLLSVYRALGGVWYDENGVKHTQ